MRELGTTAAGSEASRLVDAFNESSVNSMIEVS